MREKTLLRRSKLYWPKWTTETSNQKLLLCDDIKVRANQNRENFRICQNQKWRGFFVFGYEVETGEPVTKTFGLRTNAIYIIVTVFYFYRTVLYSAV